MIVPLGSNLHSDTSGRAEVEATGRTAGVVLADFDYGHPGLASPIANGWDGFRSHISLSVGQERAARLQPEGEPHALAASSGG